MTLGSSPDGLNMRVIFIDHFDLCDNGEGVLRPPLNLADKDGAAGKIVESDRLHKLEIVLQGWVRGIGNTTQFGRIPGEYFFYVTMYRKGHRFLQLGQIRQCCCTA